MVKQESLFGKLAKSAVLVFFANMFSMLIGFGIRIGSARLLSPGGYGQVVLAASVLSTLALIGQLGLKEGVARSLPRSDTPKKVFSSALILTLVSAISFSAILFTFATPIATSISDSTYTSALQAVAIGIPFFAVYYVCMGGFRGLEDTESKSLLDVVLQFLTIVLVISGAMFGSTAQYAIFGWVAGAILSGVFALVLVWHKTDLINRVRITSLTPTLVPLLKFSFPLMLATSIWKLMQETDNVLIGYFLAGDADIGMYDASFTLSRGILLFLWAFAFLLLPLFSKLDAEDDISQMNNLYKSAARWGVFFALPIYLILVGFPSPVLGGIFGAEYSNHGVLVTILITGFFFHIVFGLNRAALTAIGDTRFIMITAFLVYFSNVVLNVLLIPRFQVTGAAIATASSYMFMNILFSHRLYKERSITSVSVPLLKNSALAVAVYLPIYLIVSNYITPTLVSIFTVGVVYFVIQAVVILLLGEIPQEDREIISRVRSKMPI